MTIKGMMLGGIDFGEIERNMQSRQKLREQAMESQNNREDAPQQDPHFETHRLVNTVQHKGSILNVAV
jgi:hypothetical protein